jgi:nitrogen fixation-related uncharacterized protein
MDMTLIFLSLIGVLMGGLIIYAYFLQEWAVKEGLVKMGQGR